MPVSECVYVGPTPGGEDFGTTTCGAGGGVLITGGGCWTGAGGRAAGFCGA